MQVRVLGSEENQVNEKISLEPILFKFIGKHPSKLGMKCASAG